jgi:diphosphomevalonate decarboxylase
MVEMSNSTGRTATAFANANIALIKYWGNRDPILRIPSTGSISINLDGIFSRTRVTFDPTAVTDQLILNGEIAQAAALQRTNALLDRVRKMSGLRFHARVDSENNFPTGTGIASSASGFAALALAASRAAGLELDEPALSRLARSASGSACRSVPGGFVEWQAGDSDQNSYAFSIASTGHWDLVDCVAVISQTHKAIPSQSGHLLADTSPLQAARVADAPRRLAICRQAILQRDFDALAQIVELDSNLMHAVMMTSMPTLFYWLPATVRIIQSVIAWRKEGMPACYTIDAGPNVHVLCLAGYSQEMTDRLIRMEGVLRVLKAHPGGPARWLPDSD